MKRRGPREINMLSIRLQMAFKLCHGLLRSVTSCCVHTDLLWLTTILAEAIVIIIYFFVSK